MKETSAKKTTTNPLVELSASDKNAKLAKIDRPLSIDTSIDVSHRRALEIAAETISDTPKNITNDILVHLLDIFDKWRYEEGVYPPHAGLLGLLTDEKVSCVPAKEYCKKTLMVAKLKGEDAKLPAPWECCPYVSTPIGLFWRLWGKDYVPLADYIEKNWKNYETIIAVLILISDNPKSSYLPSDCVEAALKLASFRLKKQKAQIAIMLPDAEAAFNRRKQQKIKLAEKKATTKQNIEKAYEELLKKGERPMLEAIAQDAKVSKPTVCRYLREASLKRYKTK